MKEDSKINQGPKKSLRVLFRNALDEGMERDPIQNIKETYDEIIDEKDDHCGNKDLFAVNVIDETMQEDPVQHIREAYDKEMEPLDSASDMAQPKDPFQSIRDTYQQMFDSKFADKPDSENNKQKQGSQPWWKRYF